MGFGKTKGKTKVAPKNENETPTPRSQRGTLARLSKIKIQGNKEVPIVLRAIFSNYDKDGSGSLDYDDIVWVGQEMGLGEQMKSQEFVEHMMAEMQAGDLLKNHDVRADGSLSPKSSTDQSAQAFVDGLSSSDSLNEGEAEEAARTVYVGNIEPGSTLENDDALTKLFEEYGEVATATVRKKVWNCSLTLPHQPGSASARSIRH